MQIIDPPKKMRTILLEEHYATPAFMEAVNPTQKQSKKILGTAYG